MVTQDGFAYIDLRSLTANQNYNIPRVMVLQGAGRGESRLKRGRDVVWVDKSDEI